MYPPYSFSGDQQSAALERRGLQVLLGSKMEKVTWSARIGKS